MNNPYDMFVSQVFSFLEMIFMVYRSLYFCSRMMTMMRDNMY